MEVLEKICFMLMLVNIVFCLIALIKKVRVDEEQVQELTRKIPRLGSGECERALYDEIISNRKIYLMIVPGIIFLLWAMSADAGFSWLLFFSAFTSAVASTIIAATFLKNFFIRSDRRITPTLVSRVGVFSFP